MKKTPAEYEALPTMVNGDESSEPGIMLPLWEC